MKYKAKKKNDGNWAVFAGRKYFTDTVTEDKVEAEVEALYRSARWHQNQMDDIHKELGERGVLIPGDECSYLC